MVTDAPKHYPVLLNEIISIITPQHGGTFIDCTFGQGGYTQEILKYKNTKVIGLDRDLNSEKIGQKIKEKFPNRFLFKNLRFSQLSNLKLKNENVKSIIFDLGFSMDQLKDSKKGLSFNYSGSLDMRLGINKFSANEAINYLNAKELEKIMKYFGDESDAKLISKNIIKERASKNLDTQNLVKIIEKSKKRKNFKIHVATKTFQALRIFVNQEISELIYGLINAAKILKKDGVLAVVTFHSLEDKIVKYFFRNLSEHKSISRYVPEVDQKATLFRMINKKPITPSTKELNENIPSRSAKLRYVIKKEEFYNFETDIFEKFKHLIAIENFGKKL